MDEGQAVRGSAGVLDCPWNMEMYILGYVNVNDTCSNSELLVKCINEWNLIATIGYPGVG